MKLVSSINLRISKIFAYLHENSHCRDWFRLVSPSLLQSDDDTIDFFEVRSWLTRHQISHSFLGLKRSKISYYKEKSINSFLRALRLFNRNDFSNSLQELQSTKPPAINPELKSSYENICRYAMKHDIQINGSDDTNSFYGYIKCLSIVTEIKSVFKKKNYEACLSLIQELTKANVLKLGKILFTK